MLSKDMHPKFLVFLRSVTLIFVVSILVIVIGQKWEPKFIFFLLPCFLIFFTFKSKRPSVYLLDFSCLKPPSFCRIPFSFFLENASMIESFDSESVAFMAKILTSSGLSEETYLPPAFHYIPPKTHQEEAIKEVHMVLFPVMDDLLAKTKISPCDIDILIVNCSGFCTSPSLCSIIINKYSMREDIKSYSLSGMGCSAGAIAVDLGHNLLKIRKNSNAVVLSAEILSNGWYSGCEKPKLLLNCLFRMGSAAVLLTNKSEARKSSKYKLFCTLRTQQAFDDKAYFSAFREEDSKGKLGVTLNKDLLQVSGETLRAHVSILGSKILPFSEKFLHAFSIILKRFFGKPGEIYVPNFKSVINHFCLPTSGRAMIGEISKGLKLGEVECEAALMTLHRFGNQSSSSLWYELAYIEAKERVKKGDKVWQLGIGTGVKCNSVVWECLRPIVGESKRGPWANCIHRFPVMKIDRGF